MRTVFCLMLMALLPQAPTPPPQAAQPPLTFKVEVNYVEIDATVTDAQGRFVRTLTKDDFQIFEDDRPQHVSAFSMVDIPIERADPPLFAAAPVPPDVVSNRRPFDGRVFMLVLDDLHTKFSDTLRTRTAATQFVERYVGANDMVAIVNTSGSTKAMQEFTGDHRLLVQAIDRAMGVKADSATAAALQDYAMNSNSRLSSTTINADSNQVERYMNARNALRTLTNVSDYLAGIRGRRKALVYFSEGINYNTTSISDSRAAEIQRETQDLIAAATRANVSIYGVDPRGLVTGMEDTLEMGSFPSDNSIKPTDLVDEMRTEQDSLRVVSNETGGFAVLNQNDFRNGFSRILDDNSSYYVLGYYASNDKPDGRFRKVQVRVVKPGLIVHARTGYVAPSSKSKASAQKRGGPADESPALRDALDSPLAVSGLTLSLFAAPFKGSGSNDAISMSIEVDGADLQFTPDQGLYDDDLEVSLFAVDDGGKIRDGAHDQVKLHLKPSTYAAIRSEPIRILRTIQIPPGKYQLRAGVHESGAGRVGTVIRDLEAPDFSKAPLVMSGIAIASAYGSHVPTSAPDAASQETASKVRGAADAHAYDLHDVLPSPPTPAREFPRGDTLAIFADVYDNAVSTPHQVDITASVVSDGGRTIFSKSDVRATDELHGQSGGYGYTTQIPLQGVAGGRYVLRLEAKSRLGSAPAVIREVEFRVR
ncbi:MAG: VWA domain-containing protein [Vicinamibacterales bacterium]